RQAGVDVAGIGALRQAAKPARDLLSAHPVTMNEDMALTERRVVTRIAELSATLDASLRHAALDGCEFERYGRRRSRESSQRFGCGTLHVDFDAGCSCMARSEHVERYDRHVDGSGPRLSFPARRGLGRLAERVRGGRDRWVVDVEVELGHSRAAADRDRLDRHRAIAALKEVQRLDQRTLPLARPHP